MRRTHHACGCKLTFAMVLHCKGLVLHCLEEILRHRAEEGAAGLTVLCQDERRRVVIRVKLAQDLCVA